MLWVIIPLYGSIKYGCCRTVARHPVSLKCSHFSSPSTVCTLHYEPPSWVLQQKWELSHYTERRVSHWMPTTGLNMIIMLEVGLTSELSADDHETCLVSMRVHCMDHTNDTCLCFSLFSFFFYSTVHSCVRRAACVWMCFGKPGLNISSRLLSHRAYTCQLLLVLCTVHTV